MAVTTTSSIPQAETDRQKETGSPTPLDGGSEG